MNRKIKKKYKTPWTKMVWWDFRSTKSSYKTALKQITTQLERLPLQRQIAYLDLMIELIKKHLQYSLISTFWTHPQKLSGRCFRLFPMNFLDEEYEVQYIPKGEKIKVSLEKDCVIVFPESGRDLAKHWIRAESDPFQYDKYNHFAVTFTQINLTLVSNGFHSITEGILHQQGEILSSSYDFDEFVKYHDTDGEYWYFKDTNQVADIVLDYRLALIFQLYKMKTEMKNMQVENDTNE